MNKNIFNKIERIINKEFKKLKKTKVKNEQMQEEYFKQLVRLADAYKIIENEKENNNEK